MKWYSQSVVLRIEVEAELRIFFLPKRFADKFRANFGDGKEVNCYELFLIFNGFEDEINKRIPMMEIVYKRAAQHEN